MRRNIGQDKACSGWYVEINNGEYKLLPYGIHTKTNEEYKSSESKQEEQDLGTKEEEHENVVSKAASHVGNVVKQVVEAGTSAVKTENKDK